MLQADPQSRGVLPTVLYHCVGSRTLENEAALDRDGLLRQRGKKVNAGMHLFIHLRKDMYVLLRADLYKTMLRLFIT